MFIYDSNTCFSYFFSHSDKKCLKVSSTKRSDISKWYGSDLNISFYVYINFFWRRKMTILLFIHFRVSDSSISLSPSPCLFFNIVTLSFVSPRLALLSDVHISFSKVELLLEVCLPSPFTPLLLFLFLYGT